VTQMALDRAKWGEDSRSVGGTRSERGDRVPLLWGGRKERPIVNAEGGVQDHIDGGKLSKKGVQGNTFRLTGERAGTIACDETSHK